MATVVLSLSTNTVSAGLDKPNDDKTWNLDYHNYSGKGKAEGSTLYSNYYFWNAKKFKICVTNYSTKKNLKVTVYKKGKFFNVNNESVPKNGYSEWTIETSGKDSKYYIKFSAPSNFKYEVKKVS